MTTNPKLSTKDQNDNHHLEKYFSYGNGHKIQVIVIKNDVWFKGSDCAKILEYVDTTQALRTNVSSKYKCALATLISNPVQPTGLGINLKKNEGSAIFIKEAGLYQLILKSKKEEAVKFQEWVCDTVLPNLRTHGSFSIQEDKPEFKSIYDDTNITDFDNKNVIYTAYIGEFNNESLFKYGITSDIARRDYKEHQKMFADFELLNIMETDNNKVVESLFQKELKAQKLNRQLEINGKMQTELYTSTKIHTYEKINAILVDLVDKNILPALANANDKIKQLEEEKQLEDKKLHLEYELKKQQQEQEFKIKEMEIQLKMKELEIKLELEKLKYSNKEKIEAIIEEPKADYIDQYDHYLKTQTIKSTNGVWISKLYPHFIEWFGKNYKEENLPNLDNFKKSLSKYHKIEDGVSANSSSSVGIKYINIKFDNDFYQKFADQHIIEDAKSFIRTEDLVNKFKQWYRGKSLVPIQIHSVIKNYFEKNILKVGKKLIHKNDKHCKAWRGFKLI